MNDLQQFIKSLKKAEKKIIRKFLSGYARNGVSNTNMLRLFDLLNRRTKSLTLSQCAHLLFQEDNLNRTRVLKSRLKRRLLDTLTTDLILRNQSYDDDVKMSILLKKQLAQVQTLLYGHCNGQKIMFDLLDQIIEKSNLHEQYAIQEEALQIKKLLFGIRKGLDTFNEYKDQISHVKNCATTKTYMVDGYYRIMLGSDIGESGTPQFKKELDEIVKKGKQLMKKGHSMVGQYYFNILRYALASEQKNFEKEVAIMNEQKEFLQNSTTVYREGRWGATLDYLCQTKLKLGKYDEALVHAQEAKNYFKKGSLNYTVAEELIFRSYLYNGQLKEAQRTIDTIRTAYKDSMDAHRLSKHRYFYASLLFAKGQFKKCNQVIMEDFEFKKEKEGWEFNVRLLSMMCKIEQGKEDEAYTQYQNFARTLARRKKEGMNLSNRNKVIMQLMKKWLESGGNKKIANMQDDPLLSKLYTKANQWNSNGSELIDFGKWMRGRV